MNVDLEKDLHKTYEIISSNVKRKTIHIVYKKNSLQGCLNEIERNNVDRNYALHRWLNELVITDFGREYQLRSDIIRLK